VRSARRFALVILVGGATVGCGARSDLADAPAPGLVCKDSPIQPALLETIGPFKDYDRATAITVTGGDVYYSVNDGSNDPLAIYRAPIAGGAATPIVLGVPGCANSPFGYGALVTDGRYLYTPDEEEVSLCGGGSLDVTAYDLATGATSTLPNPASPVMRYVVGVRPAPGGGAIWLYGDPTPGSDTWIVRWDGTSPSVIGSIPDLAFDFIVSGDRALVATPHSLYVASLTGAADVTPAGAVDFGKLALVGANAEAFFYTPDGASVDRRDAATGEVTTVGASGVGEGAVPRWADDAWIYFSMGDTVTSSGAELGRVPETGGEVEVIYDDASRDGIDVVTSDACNVYWVAEVDFADSKPAALFVRGR
jgi:hypothetical protein